MIFGRGKTVKGLGFTVKPEHTNKTKRGAYGGNVMRALFTSVPVCGAGAKTGVLRRRGQENCWKR